MNLAFNTSKIILFNFRYTNSLTSVKDMWVIIGNINLKKAKKYDIFDLKKIYVHPEYKNIENSYDIAILEVLYYFFLFIYFLVKITNNI